MTQKFKNLKKFVAYKYFFDLYETLNVADKLIKFLHDTKIYFLINFYFLVQI